MATVPYSELIASTKTKPGFHVVVRAYNGQAKIEDGGSTRKQVFKAAKETRNNVRENGPRYTETHQPMWLVSVVHKGVELYEINW